MKLAGITRSQFYYAVKDGKEGLRSHFLHAALRMHQQMTQAQRTYVCEAIQALNLGSKLSFPDALAISIAKKYPIRRSSWGYPFITVYGTRVLLCRELSESESDYSPGNDDMLATDWEIAIPDREYKGL